MKTSLPLYAFLIFFLIKTQAQTPQVMSVFPAAQTISAEANGELIIDFDMAIDPASVSPETVRIFGRWSGTATGLLSLANNNTQIRFQPAEPFFAGEWVMAALTKGVKSETGEALEPCYAWNFWIATTPGELEQELIQTIELRLPGEGELQTYGAYAGDMNNDGYSDLVAVNETSDDLRILMNDGTGRYLDFEIYDTGENSTPSPSEGADFNNDGEIDIVVTTAWDTEVRVLTGDGNGGFSNMDTYYTSNGVRGVVVGDFNGDGWDDMLTTNRIGGNISIFTNNGDGTFSQSNMDLPGQDENTCAMTDANGDGVLDVLYGTHLSQHLGILLGDGSGDFTPSSQISVQGRPWMVGAGDLNGDGNVDMATVLSNTNKVAISFGDGQGGLGEPVHYAPPNFIFPVAIDLGDIDGDGDLDIATSSYSSSTYTIMENDGTGQFTEMLNLSAPGASSCVILHDRDNDGDLDITGTDEVDDLVLLFENADSSFISSANEALKNTELLLSPNPVREELKIQTFLAHTGQVKFQILNSSGVIITKWKETLPPNHSYVVWEVDKGLPSGLYYLKVESKERQMVRKFLLKN